jgi:hypothetical protein
LKATVANHGAQLIARTRRSHQLIHPDLDAWVTFKAEHGVEPRMIEPTLVMVIQHLCTLSLELTQEVGRLSAALHKRAG